MIKALSCCRISLLAIKDVNATTMQTLLLMGEVSGINPNLPHKGLGKIVFLNISGIKNTAPKYHKFGAGPEHVFTGWPLHLGQEGSTLGKIPASLA